MKWKKRLLDKAITFINNLKNEVSIVYGHDCDSIASACIIYKLLKNLSMKPKLFVSKYNFEVDEETLKKIKKYENVIIVDIGDTQEDVINSFSQNKNVLLIDHHPPKKYKINYINPRTFKKNIYMPTSYICWLIYKSFFDDKEILWIAGFGTLGDFGAKNNKDLFLKIKKVEKKLIDNVKIEDRELIEKSLLGKITKMVDSCRIFGDIEGIKYVTKIICQAKNYEDFLKDKKINNYYLKLNAEIKKEIRNIRKNAILTNKFLFYEIKSKYNLKSSLASILPAIYKDKIILIAQKNREGFYEISVRRGVKLKTNLSKLVGNISKSTSAKGGGHPTAAGMRIDKIEELLNWIKKWEKKRKTT